MVQNKLISTISISGPFVAKVLLILVRNFHSLALPNLNSIFNSCPKFSIKELLLLQYVGYFCVFTNYSHLRILPLLNIFLLISLCCEFYIWWPSRFTPDSIIALFFMGCLCHPQSQSLMLILSARKTILSHAILTQSSSNNLYANIFVPKQLITI